MRISVRPCDHSGCGYYRLRWVAEALADEFDIEVTEEPFSVVWRPTPPGQPDVPVGLQEVPQVEVVVLQRPLRWELAMLIPLLQRHGIAVVVDIDDDFAALDPKNPAFALTHPRSSTKGDWRALAEACRRANLVTVSTPQLAKTYGGHGRVRVLRNCVPGWYLDITADREPTEVIGWTGNPTTHPGDADVMGTAVRDVMRDLPLVRFRAIGSETTGEVLGIDVHNTGWVDLADGSYARTVATLDVGLAPLRESRFNTAKSYLKPLEYAALGVPFVASSTPEYELLHRRGVGIIARRPREWKGALKSLLTNEALRTELAGQGREAVRELTYERQAHQWADAWSSVSTRRSLV